MRSLHLLPLAALALGIAACDSPTQGKPKASVSAPVAPATPESRAASESRSYRFDQQTSQLEFVGAKVTGKEEGHFEAFEGTIDVVAGRPETGRVSVEIPLSSMSVAFDKLKQHLLSEDFFAAGAHPTAKFVSTKIARGGAGGAPYTVTGNLTLRGVEKAISFPARIDARTDRVTADAEFSFNRHDFGVSYPGAPDNLIADEILVRLHIDAGHVKGS